MSTRKGTTPGLVHALDVEVRIMANEGQAPIWISHPDEAGHWVLESVQEVFHAAVEGVVQIEHEYAEPHSFDQFMKVFAPPTPGNRDRLDGDLRDYANKIQSEIISRFGSLKTMPVVRVDLNRDFADDSTAIVPTLVGNDPYHSSNGQRGQMADYGGRGVPVVMVASPDGNGHAGGNGNDGGGLSLRGAATMWMGIALGAMMISSVFLLIGNRKATSSYEEIKVKYENLVGDVDKKVDAKMTSYRARYLARYREFYTYESEAKRVHALQAEQIANLARKANAPKPAPVNLPSPPRPDPFDQELLPAGTDIYELYTNSQPASSSTPPD